MLHPRDIAVTLAARDATAVMRLVAEMDEPRKDIDALPRNGFTRLPVGADLAEFGVLDIDDAVAAHAATRTQPRINQGRAERGFMESAR